MEKDNPFNPADWEKYIVTEDGEKCQCPNCKRIIEGGEVGSHFYCQDCKRYVWRKIEK